MTMTREEAIYTIERLAHTEAKWPGTEDTLEALGMALSALRPVSREQELEAENKELKERIVNWRKYMTPTREQVEKVWKGEWIGDNDEKVGTIDGSPIKSSTCSVCGNWLVGSDEYDCSGHFCPACGRAMTDEAVQMVMERLEALCGQASD